MPGREVYRDSRMRQQWDYGTRVYTAWDNTGAQVEQRAFTVEEIAEADAAAVIGQAEATENALRTNLGASAVFDNLRTIANGSGTFATAAIRDGAIRTCARAIVILIRLTLRRLDAVD